MTVNFNDFNFYNIKKTKLENNPVVRFYQNKGTDSVQIRPFYQVENERLEKTYGIKSTIKNPDLLRKVSASIEDFCNINKNNNLFNGLKLEEKPFKKIYMFDDKNKKLVFNSCCSWDKVDDFTKKVYNDAKIGADNKNYFLYKALGEFLNYSYIPEDYKEISANIEPFMAVRMQRICSPDIDYSTEETGQLELTNDAINDFKSSYIATRMSGKHIPKVLTKYFEQLYGNKQLKFPKSENPLKVDNNKKKFHSVKDAQKYLDEKFKIKARFDNIEYANACISAVEELTQAIGDENIFNGLEIFTTNKPFLERDKNSHAFTTKDGKIFLRKNDKIGSSQSIMKEAYDCGSASANTVKNNIFIHELSHFLDYRGEDFEDEDMSKKQSLNDTGKRIASSVSGYASTDIYEFCAEYVSGRMAGNKYPSLADKIFQAWWKGPTINFPE